MKMSVTYWKMIPGEFLLCLGQLYNSEKHPLMCNLTAIELDECCDYFGSLVSSMVSINLGLSAKDAALFKTMKSSAFLNN